MGLFQSSEIVIGVPVAYLHMHNPSERGAREFVGFPGIRDVFNDRLKHGYLLLGGFIWDGGRLGDVSRGCCLSQRMHG
jgi:hypothetical protein